MFMSGEFSVFNLNNQLSQSSDWLICPPQPKELLTVATINYLFFGNFKTSKLAATYINTKSFKEPSSPCFLWNPNSCGQETMCSV